MEFRMKKIVLSLAVALGTAPALASAATEVNWGGDIIIRPFYRDNARDFSNSNVGGTAGANDKKQFTTERTRLKANIKVEEDIGGVVELLHFRKWGAADPNRVVDNNGAPNGVVCTTLAGPPPTTTCSTPALDDNWMDMNQAYIEVKHLFDTQITMRAGRQEMAYGDQRLVGNTNFWSTYPFPRAYDALKFNAKYETFDIDAWHATVTERAFASLFGTPSSATNKNSDRMFNGIWATLKMIPDNTLDLYYLNMDDAGYLGTGGLSPYEGTSLPPNFGHFPYAPNGTGTAAANLAKANGDTKVYNFGTRLKGKYSNLDYTVELNTQTGHFADGANIGANGGAALVGYTMPEAMGLRISGEYVFASGDDTPTAGDHKTFYQFTPSPHMHLGAQDFIAFQNINAWRIGASFNAKKNLKVSLDFWDFKLDKQQDYWYGSNGISTRSGAGNAALAGVGGVNNQLMGAEGLLADKNIGTEVDLVAKYEYSPPLSLEVGYSSFNPGSGIKNTATANLAGHTKFQGDSATFAWGMLMLKF